MSTKYNIHAHFDGTGRSYKRNGAKKYNNLYKNVGYKDSTESGIKFYFNGPTIPKIGKRSFDKIAEEGKEVLENKIKEELAKGNEVHITITGHSRGGVISTKVNKYLTAKYKDKNLTIRHSISDPYYGPTAKGQNALSRQTKDEKTIVTNSIVAYAVQTLFRCTPQQIVGTDVVIITNVGHNQSYFAVYEANDLKPGLYLGTLNKKWSFEKITASEENIKKYFDFIYKYGKITQTNRWRLFTSILIQKLGLKSYDDLESIVKTPKSILFPNVTKEFDKALNSIKKSINLTFAFKIANNLFLPGGIFSGLGGRTFHLHLQQAQKNVCGQNDNYTTAIKHLEAIMLKQGRTPESIKWKVAHALIHRIKKWYN